MAEIQERLVQENYAGLADDDFDVLTEHAAKVVYNEDMECVVDDEENLDEIDSREPLYEGSSKCIGAVMLLLCCFIIRFRLSDEALSYLISFIGLLLPPGHKMVQSLYRFRKFMTKYIHSPQIMCSFCLNNVDKDVSHCPNEFCSKDLKLPGVTSYFVQHSIITQLQVMFKRQTVTEKIRTHRFQHYKNNVNGIFSDVYDGSMYTNLFSKGFLDKENNISFAFNTDGVPIFKSSKISLWPVYLLINELPIADRKLRENVLSYGVWISAKKPIIWSFFKPLYDDISRLEDGVPFEDHNGSTFICKATLLTCTCDLPARCLVSNSMQFNGKYGCWFCLQQGETYRTEKGGHCHVFPFKEDDPKGPPRSVLDINSDIKKVCENIYSGNKNDIVRGVNGPFWFMYLKYFDPVNGFVIDYMHGVCSGVMKL